MTNVTYRVLDIINLALKDCGALGVGQVALAEDVNDAFTRLRWMMAQWSNQRWLVYHLVDGVITSTGALNYSIGPGGQIAGWTDGGGVVHPFTVRPDRIESAFFRQTIQSSPSQIDYPLQLVQSKEEYNRIALKQLQSFPSYLFYDSDTPLGYLYPWPVIQPAIYELHVSVKQILDQFTSITQVVSFPDEYLAAIHFNLTKRLCHAYKLPVDADLRADAKESLAIVRGANVQIGQLRMPQDLVRPGVYNPYSDQVR